MENLQKGSFNAKTVFLHKPVLPIQILNREGECHPHHFHEEAGAQGRSARGRRDGRDGSWDKGRGAETVGPSLDDAVHGVHLVCAAISGCARGASTGVHAHF